jgi:hypothetical protein
MQYLPIKNISDFLSSDNSKTLEVGIEEKR